MEENDIDLSELIAILVRNLRKIFLITMLFLGGAALYLSSVPPVYESVSLLRIKQPQVMDKSLSNKVPGVAEVNVEGLSGQQLNTYAEILKSSSVVESATGSIEKTTGIGVTAVPVNNTEILKVTVSAETPQLAQKANELIIAGFLDRLTELKRNERKTTRESLAKSLKEAERELHNAKTGVTERGNIEAGNPLSVSEQELVYNTYKIEVAQNIYAMLAQRLEEAKLAEVMASNGVQIIDTPKLPGEPVKPRKMMTIVFALLLGLMVGSGYVLASELFNRKDAKYKEA